MEPGTPFVPGWHIDAICEHLQAASRGQIRKLIINIPPRHMKSLAASVFWPTWVWTWKPESRWLFASYAQSLSIRDSLKCRRIIESPWYQRAFPHVQLAGDQNVKGRYDNTREGYRLATSVGGAVTGEGGDFIVVDDPHNVQEVESAVVREGVLNWYDQSLSTRANDPKTVVFVVIMQRLHEKDLTGHLLEQGGWCHLKLPAEYECKKVFTDLGWSDPRTVKGEFLWPERFGPTELTDLKRSLGTYGAAGQLQQEPVPPSGGILKRHWFRYYQPARDRKTVRLGEKGPLYRVSELSRFITVDPALTESEEADYCVMACWGILRQRPTVMLLLDLIRERMEGPDILPALDSLRTKWHPAFTALETIAFQKMIFQEARRKGWGIREVSYSLEAIVRIDRDKVARTYAASPFIEQGRLWLPSGAIWLPDYEKELVVFPKGEHDDQVDVTTIAVAMAMKWAGGGEEANTEPEPRPPNEDDDPEPPEEDDGEDHSPLILPWRRT